ERLLRGPGPGLGRPPSCRCHRRNPPSLARVAARPLSLLGSGKSNGRGTKGVGPSHRENGNGQQGKGFSAKTITYRSAGEAAQEGEREQDAGSKPGRGRDADRRRMGSER